MKKEILYCEEKSKGKWHKLKNTYIKDVEVKCFIFGKIYIENKDYKIDYCEGHIYIFQKSNINCSIKICYELDIIPDKNGNCIENLGVKEYDIVEFGIEEIRINNPIEKRTIEKKYYLLIGCVYNIKGELKILSDCMIPSHRHCFKLKEVIKLNVIDHLNEKGFCHVGHSLTTLFKKHSITTYDLNNRDKYFETIYVEDYQ